MTANRDSEAGPGATMAVTLRAWRAGPYLYVETTIDGGEPRLREYRLLDDDVLLAYLLAGLQVERLGAALALL